MSGSECEAEHRLHDFQDGSMAFLSCDILQEDHAGLNHHDPAYGIWWGRCSLEDHGHAGQDTQRVRGAPETSEAAP